MQTVTIMSGSPGLGNFASPSPGRRPPAPHENGKHTKSTSVVQNGLTPSYDNMNSTDIKKAAIESVLTTARNASAMTLIKSAGSRYREGRSCEDNGDLKKSMFAYYQAMKLASMVVEKEQSPPVKKEIDDFFAVCQSGPLELLPIFMP